MNQPNDGDGASVCHQGWDPRFTRWLHSRLPEPWLLLSSFSTRVGPLFNETEVQEPESLLKAETIMAIALWGIFAIMALLGFISAVFARVRMINVVDKILWIGLFVSFVTSIVNIVLSFVHKDETNSLSLQAESTWYVFIFLFSIAALQDTSVSQLTSACKTRFLVTIVSLIY